MMDTLNICQFVFGPAWQLYGPGQIVEAVQNITGWDVDLDELQLVGERRLNLLRAFNAREGIGRDADVMPKKMYKALKGGASDGIALNEEELEKAKDTYYAEAGWDVATGVPTREKLEELELDWLAELMDI